MNGSFTTQQEEFWAGEFGNEYSSRNIGDHWIASNTALFSKIFSNCRSVSSLIEFGANIGLNLKAIHGLLPDAKLSAIEINSGAAEKLKQWGKLTDVFHSSILDFKQEKKWDVVLIKGVLIHINPERLVDVYQAMYEASQKYIIVCEYYNPSPVEIMYRGHEGKLFKRDFASEMLEKYKDLKLVDYGFVWRKDPMFPQDDCTWFLLEKTK